MMTTNANDDPKKTQECTGSMGQVAKIQLHSDEVSQIQNHVSLCPPPGWVTDRLHAKNMPRPPPSLVWQSLA